MRIPIDEVFYFGGTTRDPATGAVSDADSTPTFEVFEEATDTDIGVGGNMTKRTSKTGVYRGSFTASAANGFEAGKWYHVFMSATVNSVADTALVAVFQCVPAEASAGIPKVDIGSTATLTEAYAADGAAPTAAQMLYAIQQFLQESSIAGTTLTVKKLDGSTSAMTFTLNDATNPTGITRAS